MGLWLRSLLCIDGGDFGQCPIKMSIKAHIQNPNGAESCWGVRLVSDGECPCEISEK